MPIKQWYKSPGLSESAHLAVKTKVRSKIPENIDVQELKTELCFYVHTKTDLTDDEAQSLCWIITTPFQERCVASESFLTNNSGQNIVLFEFGPRLNFSTAFSTNVVSMCQSVGLRQVDRVEVSTRYLFTFQDKMDGRGDFTLLSELQQKEICDCLHDKMTECCYLEPIKSFDLEVDTEPVFEVDILGEGKKALEKANATLGLAFDDWDLQYYADLFTSEVKRNPTSVECFDLAQSNSEHSRHWFFKGRMVVDGNEHDDSLFTMVMNTQKNSNNNNVIKFSDNSSAIEGFSISTLIPQKMTESSSYTRETDKTRHIIFTAETHNFPTGVAPFSGATTGTGGRIRDVQAAGRGAHVIAGTAGYSFGNLNIPGYKLPWEDETFDYPPNFAPPREIAIEASNGASDYGNKFGEPVLTGFARSFGLRVLNERREWVKPIMFSGGIGSIEADHTQKEAPENGMQVVKVGGPVYRIGVGGGAASSIQIQGDNEAHLDFGAVQRGDAEMEQKMNRVIRACVEMGGRNPICSIHDQGAGGNGNVLKEISEPAGAVIRAGAFTLGDPTLSVLELWGAEYQESNAVLIRSQDQPALIKIGNREKCPVDFVGHITGDGKIKLVTDEEETEPVTKHQRTVPPVDLDLELVLGSMPRKVFKLSHKPVILPALVLPDSLTVREALDRVLRLPSVASKRYLTNKVDRSVTGLVAQQQCVGPLHTPLADVAVMALSHFDQVGAATAIGEQPIKGLIDPGCGARMTVGEALTNLVCARVTDIRDVKCSGNWMWPAKLPGEGALLYDTCEAMCEVMKQLGVAVDGGKDSLSMAARVGQETVKAPGTLVVSTYVGCPDITATLTPDLKCPNGKGCLMWVRFGSREHHRVGGSALAQCYKQLGNLSPDMDSPEMFVKAFTTTQSLLKDGLLLSGHDISDGGLITCVLEMAFAGNCGLDLNIPHSGSDHLSVLFAEELGLICEVEERFESKVLDAFKQADVPALLIGHCYTPEESHKCLVKVKVGSDLLLDDSMTVLRDVWEETSFKLEAFQTNPACVEQERAGLKMRRPPQYSLGFDPVEHMKNIRDVCQFITQKPRVAIIREEGSNGDREMASAFYMAGFETWDVNMYDLCQGQVTLDRFRGVAFVGGFSYADAMGSAKGWAAVLKFNEDVRKQLRSFYRREDSFSLGVCNGCQLMALLGWVAPDTGSDSDAMEAAPGCRLGHNDSQRFESRFVTVRIQKTPAIMLKGMENSVLGIWVQHGEGKFMFKSTDIQANMTTNGLVPIQYTDDAGEPTESYPLNPNGSPGAIAALCSTDGRHLAVMPHPERSCLSWQWPWMPKEWHTAPWRKDLELKYVSPWLAMFYNAFQWCSEE